MKEGRDDVVVTLQSNNVVIKPKKGGAWKPAPV